MISLSPDHQRLLLEFARNQGVAGLIYLDIVRLEPFELNRELPYGEQLLLAVQQAIHELHLNLPSILQHFKVGNDFFLYVQCEETGMEAASRCLEQTGEKIRETLDRLLQQQYPLAPLIPVAFGCALLRFAEGCHHETIVYEAMKQSIRNAKDRLIDPELTSLLPSFHSILQEQRLTTHYQPIVSLADGHIFGYEALTRGPEASPLRSPLKLFQLAEQVNKLYVLDRMTRERAILGCSQLDKHQRIFLNIPAHIFHDPDFTPGVTLPLLQQHGLSPSNVVFELTERSSIEDFPTFKKLIDHYRSQGYRIAIDDAGAGYSSLQAIAEIQPDYIKVDRSLVQNLHKDKVKEYILETFISFSKRLNIKVIAEGIEQPEEVEKLIQLGVHYAQGYFIGRPQEQMVDISPEVRETIRLCSEKHHSMLGSQTIGELVTRVKAFECSKSVADAAKFFQEHESEFGAVVVDQGKPVGLLMREELFRKLAVQYGISLYWNKPILVVTDQEPLMVDADTPVESVSQLAMMRETSRLYDLVIVTHEDKLVGVAAVRDILERMTNIRMEHARVSNPLTGLPGNLPIQRELQRRIMADEAFALIYTDLDHFKWFNDKYGFQRGDEVIQYTADILQQSVFVCGEPTDFVGHVGGDDFVIITGTSRPDTMCEELIRRFHQGISFYYEDRIITYVEDRYGNRMESNGLSLSLSFIEITNPSQVSPEMISQAAARCKKEAKSTQGSAVAHLMIPEA